VIRIIEVWVVEISNEIERIMRCPSGKMREEMREK
jgi:hypothetical protein